MANYKLVQVETLGSLLAFKKGEIQILASAYNSVPANKKEDLQVVCNQARAQYESSVSEAKARGEKPHSAALKTKVINEIVKPFIAQVGGTVGAAKIVKKEVTEIASTIKQVRRSRVVFTEEPLTPEIEAKADRLWGNRASDEELQSMVHISENVSAGIEVPGEAPAEDIKDLLSELGDEFEL